MVKAIHDTKEVYELLTQFKHGPQSYDQSHGTFDTLKEAKKAAKDAGSHWYILAKVMVACSDEVTKDRLARLYPDEAA